jgi:small subunit ribosomal protein S14
MAKQGKLERFKRPQKFKVRTYNRCHVCGNPRSYMRRFGICRICFRELAHKGELPGVMKSSW